MDDRSFVVSNSKDLIDLQPLNLERYSILPVVIAILTSASALVTSISRGQASVQL
jgi:hypothetical protein